jgi:hypothetical protein
VQLAEFRNLESRGILSGSGSEFWGGSEQPVPSMRRWIASTIQRLGRDDTLLTQSVLALNARDADAG